MILLDANILLYAYNASLPEHARAVRWLEKTISEESAVGIPWQVAWAFLRIGTSPRVFTSPLSTLEAIEIVRSWTDLSNVHFLSPTAGHFAHLESALVSGKASGSLVSDGVLAAMAMEYGATLASTDRDFARFPGLAWLDPLA